VNVGDMCFKTSIAESLEGSHVIDARAGGCVKSMHPIYDIGC